MVDEQQEKDIQDLISQYTQQQSGFAGGGQQFEGNPNQGVDSHSGIDNQGTVDNSTPIAPGMLTPSKGVDPIPAGNVCQQCNMVHPPIPHGQKCPNAMVKSISEENTEVVVDVNKYLVGLQNILMSKIDQNKIKDVNKLFQNITLEITKFLEEYIE